MPEQKLGSEADLVVACDEISSGSYSKDVSHFEVCGSARTPLSPCRWQGTMRDVPSESFSHACWSFTAAGRSSSQLRNGTGVLLLIMTECVVSYFPGCLDRFANPFL